MEPIFTKRKSVISSFIAPWILGVGAKTPDEAKKYIKFGETLNPLYYPANKSMIDKLGETDVYDGFMKKLFHKNNIDSELSDIVGENVYKPWDCLSGIYQIEITHEMGLVARPDGITVNNECVIMSDNYITRFYRNTEEEIKIKLLATMAVWKAKRGLYYIKKIDKKIYINFDDIEWEDILNKIKIWAETVF